VTPPEAEIGAGPGAKAKVSGRPRGRPRTNGLSVMRRAVTTLGTRRLDGRSSVAIAVKRWKTEVTADLGGDLSTAQATILESAARKLVLRDSLAAWIAQQSSVVTRKRTVVPVVREFLQITDSLARDLERLGLERVERDVSLEDYLASKKDGEPASS
jgi:hypothetical protein